MSSLSTSVAVNDSHNSGDVKSTGLQTQLSQDELAQLFPLPQFPPSRLYPLRISGVDDAESAETSRRLLQDNHERWHVMFNDMGYHNHASHHILATYTLGAPKGLIETVYPIHTWYQRPLSVSPEAITEGNFKQHLGDPKFYHSYASFFRTRILKHGENASSLIERFIFSEKFNFRSTFGDSPASGDPHMLARLLASVFHPFIHMGNACEFGIPGLLAEGLAEACVHSPDIESILTREFLGFNAAHAHSDSERSDSSKPNYTHLLTVLAAINADQELILDFEGLDGIQKFNLVMRERGGILRTYVDRWIGTELVSSASAKVDKKDEDGTGLSVEVENLLEQLVWAVSLIYGVSGWRSAERGFLADFFCMHVLTASLFLHSILPHLSPRTQLTLLRTFLLQSLAWWVSRGRNPIDIAAYYDGVGAADPIGAYPTPGRGGARGSEEVDEPAATEMMPEQVEAERQAKIGRVALAEAAGGELPTYSEFSAYRGFDKKTEGTGTPASGSTTDEEDGDPDGGDVHSTPMTSASESIESLPSIAKATDKFSKTQWQTGQNMLTQALHPSPWTAILRASLLHPEEHVCKTVRALSHYAQLWGSCRNAGDVWFSGGAEGSGSLHLLPGLERLDGTLFVRIAGMTMDRLGWMRDSDKHGVWAGRAKSALASATASEQKMAEQRTVH